MEHLLSFDVGLSLYWAVNVFLKILTGVYLGAMPFSLGELIFQKAKLQRVRFLEE